jgi:hypothetical protein
VALAVKGLDLHHSSGHYSRLRGKEKFGNPQGRAGCDGLYSTAGADGPLVEQSRSQRGPVSSQICRVELTHVK